MKIAILFSGRINYYKDVYNNIIDKIVNNYQIDFYLSTSPDISNQDDINGFIDLYNPIKVINEPINHDFDYNKYEKLSCWVRPQNICDMWYNRMRVFNVIEDKYDIILSYRLDLNAFNCINYDINDFINIPLCDDYSGGVNDQIAYGNYNEMKKYMNLYSYIPEILNNCKMHPETILKYYINNYNLNIKRCEKFIYYIINNENYGKDMIYCISKKYVFTEDLTEDDIQQAKRIKDNNIII